jgi:AcrR family transcriptional regulator
VEELDGRLRKTPRQARSRSTVEAILEAAERVLRSEGYHAASTNRVARVAGFSVGSLYQYFDDKRAVVGALLDQALRGEAERIGQALDALARLEPAVARDRLVRSVLAERRGKAHLLRILDAHGRELGYEAPLRHALRAQAGLLADPLHRFAAARLANSFRGAFDEGLAVVARFLHALSYALAVDAPEHLDEESIAARVSAALLRLETAPATPGKLAGELHAAWVGGAGAAFADAPARARRLRETRSALVSSGTIPAPQLEPAVFVAAAIGEVVAELRDEPPKRLSQSLAYEAAARLLEASLAVEA